MCSSSDNCIKWLTILLGFEVDQLYGLINLGYANLMSTAKSMVIVALPSQQITTVSRGAQIAHYY
jgi:hypothetical protein